MNVCSASKVGKEYRPCWSLSLKTTRTKPKVTIASIIEIKKWIVQCSAQEKRVAEKGETTAPKAETVFSRR